MLAAAGSDQHTAARPAFLYSMLLMRLCWSRAVWPHQGVLKSFAKED